MDLSSFNVFWNVNGNNARTSAIVAFKERMTCTIVREFVEVTVITDLIDARRSERKCRRTPRGDALDIKAYECSASMGLVRSNASSIRFRRSTLEVENLSRKDG